MGPRHAGERCHSLALRAWRAPQNNPLARTACFGRAAPPGAPPRFSPGRSTATARHRTRCTFGACLRKASVDERDSLPCFVTETVTNVNRNVTTVQPVIAFGVSAITASVVSKGPATEAASCGARHRKRQINLDAPLCFDPGVDTYLIQAGSGLPESCPRNGDMPQSPFTHRQRWCHRLAQFSFEN